MQKIKLRTNIEGQNVAPQVEVEMNEGILEFVSSFQFLGSYFGKDWRAQDDVKMYVVGGLKTSCGLKMMFNIITKHTDLIGLT